MNVTGIEFELTTRNAKAESDSKVGDFSHNEGALSLAWICQVTFWVNNPEGSARTKGVGSCAIASSVYLPASKNPGGAIRLISLAPGIAVPSVSEWIERSTGVAYAGTKQNRTGSETIVTFVS